MNLSKEELGLLRNMIVFYRHHHMSANNPQQKSVDVVLDKISKDIRSDVTNAGSCDTDCPCSCHRVSGDDKPNK